MLPVLGDIDVIAQNYEMVTYSRVRREGSRVAHSLAGLSLDV